MRAGLDALAGTVVVDVPDRATAVRDEFEARGFAPERPYIRMARGRDDGFGEAALVHAIAARKLG